MERNPSRGRGATTWAAALAVAASGLLAPVPVSSQEALATNTPPGEVIFARRVLMGSMDVLMQEIEAFSADAARHNTEVEFEAAQVADELSVMLQLVAHLYPAGTDIWSEEAEAADPTGVTLATPELWAQFPEFYRQANEAAEHAFALSRQTPRDAAWRESAADLRGRCESCHTAFSRFQLQEDPAPPLPTNN